ncbi:MAG: hypothetical protein WB627_09975 [Candidatus Acidiferrum sp.]
MREANSEEWAQRVVALQRRRKRKAIEYFGRDAALTVDEFGEGGAGDTEGGGTGGKEKDEERFHRDKTRDGEAVLSAQADRFAGANLKENASAYSVRNDVVGGGRE